MLEIFLTVGYNDFNKYYLIGSKNTLQSSEDAYHYSKLDNFVLRAQLDAYDHQLPKKTFDIKTRALHAIRMNVEDFQNQEWYAIKAVSGAHQSFEREYFDMLRSPMIKYYFQAKIGNMDGIFVCYHNVKQIFGFEYLNMERMAHDIFGSKRFADMSFQYSLQLSNAILEAITSLNPSKDLYVFLDSARSSHGQNSVTSIHSDEDLYI
jgi:hypothetical protein